MRLFSRHYPQLADSISAPLVRISTKHAANSVGLISAPAVRKSETDAPTPLSPELVLRFTWTHLADLVRIDTQLASATDEVVKREYEESKKAIQKRVEALNAIGVQSDRIEAQLSSTAAALSGVQAELVRLHALGPQLASQLVPAQLRIVRELTTQLTQFEQEVSRLSL